MGKAETALTNKIRGHVESVFPVSLTYKYHGSGFGVSGVPDFVFLWRGRAIFIEVKVPGEKPTPKQVYEMGRINATGVRATWVCSPDEAVSEINRIMKEYGDDCG